MSQPLVIKELAQTCLACPSQWEGWLEDGRPLYIRYRWGELSVHVGPLGSGIEDAITAAPWFEETAGDDGWDGFIEIEVMLALTGLAKRTGAD